MVAEEKSEEKLINELREILNGIMEDYSCGRQEALRIATQWLMEAEARKAKIKKK